MTARTTAGAMVLKSAVLSGLQMAAWKVLWKVEQLANSTVACSVLQTVAN